MTPSCHATPHKAGRGQNARAFTLIELMVSVVILTVILMSFGTVLSQSQRVVSSAQRATMVNSAGAAISQIIRHDLMGLCKEGFLAVNSTSLSFIATNDYANTLVNTDSNSYSVALIDYGMADSNALYRRVTVQNPANVSNYPSAAIGARPTIANPPTLATDLQMYLGQINAIEVAYVDSTVQASTWSSTSGASPWTVGTNSWSGTAAKWPQAIRVRFWLTEYDDLKLFEVIVFTGM